MAGLPSGGVDFSNGEDCFEQVAFHSNGGDCFEQAAFLSNGGDCFG